MDAGSSHRTLQKDVHAAEQELLEDIQRRTCSFQASELRPSSARFTLLPCSTCIEILEDKIFTDWLDDRTNAETAIPLCAHMVVYFEDAIPPAYIRKAGKWSLAQGVGPKDLEVKLPFQLPAGQFKTLLPPTSPPLRPPCWPKKGDSHQDLPEKWQARRFLLEQFFRLVSCGWSQVSSESEEFRRAPLIGQVLPCVSDMLVAAEKAFEALGKVGRLKKSSKAGVDAARGGYVKVPLLAVEEAFRFWKVEILVNALSAMKAPVDLVCVRCPADVRHRAGYSPKYNRIRMCANRFWNPFEFRRVLVHELTHAFDFARAKVDTGSCVHMACTEIRAWNLSGECDLWANSFKYMGEDMINRKQRCVKDGALASLLENERCQDSHVAHGALEEAWAQCWKDYWPFTTKPDLDTRWRQSPMLR